MIGVEANPPNFSFRCGRKVGSWGIPAKLSAAKTVVALSAYKVFRATYGVDEQLSVGACLCRLFILQKYGGTGYEV